MFEGATSANPDVSNWDTGQVQGMSKMFENAAAANPNMSQWRLPSLEMGERTLVSKMPSPIVVFRPKTTAHCC